MTTDAFTQSVALVVLGAAITLVTTLLTEYLRGRREDRREREREVEAARAKQREEGREHTLEVHNALSQLETDAVYAMRNGRTVFPNADLMATVKSRYLLIPDKEIRELMAMGLTLIINKEEHQVTDHDWLRAVSTSAFVVAAYLRGDRPGDGYSRELTELRDKYVSPGSP